MKHWNILIIILKNSSIRKVSIYIILWFAGLVVAVAVLFFWDKSEKFENISIFNNLEGLPDGNKVSNNIVDELLLSANELNIYGKSSLIEHNLKSNSQQSDLLIQQIKTNPNNAYQTILKNKLQKLKQPQTATSDFNIKPVPK